MPMPESGKIVYNYLAQARGVDQEVLGKQVRIWAVYQAPNKLLAFLRGQFKGTVDYAMEIQNRANRLWRAKGKRRRGDRFKVFLSHVNETRFKAGW